MLLSERQTAFAILGITALMIVSSSGPAHGQQRPAVSVSLIQLIATPERFDGKLVSVVGFLSFGGVEGDGLYLHKDDRDNGTGNAVRIDRTKEMLRDRERLYDNYVVIVGVFRHEEKPAIYVSTGRITNIQRCAFISQPDHPMHERLKELQTHEPKDKHQ
jgi:hypothetical protein